MSASSVPCGAFRGERLRLLGFSIFQKLPGPPVSPRAPRSRPHFALCSRASRPPLGAPSPALFARLSSAQSSGTGRLPPCPLALQEEPPGTPSSQLRARTPRGLEGPRSSVLGHPRPWSGPAGGRSRCWELPLSPKVSPGTQRPRPLAQLGPPPIRPIRGVPGHLPRPPPGVRHGSAPPSPGPSPAPVHVTPSARPSANRPPVSPTPHSVTWKPMERPAVAG